MDTHAAQDMPLPAPLDAPWLVSRDRRASMSHADDDRAAFSASPKQVQKQKVLKAEERTKLHGPLLHHSELRTLAAHGIHQTVQTPPCHLRPKGTKLDPHGSVRREGRSHVRHLSRSPRHGCRKRPRDGVRRKCRAFWSQPRRDHAPASVMPRRWARHGGPPVPPAFPFRGVGLVFHFKI